MFEARIRRSNPGMFSWEKLKCQIPLDEIDRDRLYTVVQMGVNKGRIPGSALALQDTSALLTHFNLMDSTRMYSMRLVLCLQRLRINTTINAK